LAELIRCWHELQLTIWAVVLRRSVQADRASTDLLHKQSDHMPVRFKDLLVAAVLAGATAALAPPINPAIAQTAAKAVTTASGLQVIDTTPGTGASPKAGDICVMHYTGWR
jgi:FKBP-type peptidyl-prolyl cis-trans isomerase